MLLNVGHRITMLGGNNTPVAIYEITRVTTTQAVIQKENSFVGKLDVKFKREIRGEDSLFCEYGDSGWNKKYYRLTREADAEQIQATKRRKIVSETSWSRVSDEKVAKILTILQETK